MPNDPRVTPDSIESRTLLTRRVLPHAPLAVWRAWIEPERLARWWGPAGFTNTFEVFEPVPGGTWKFVMHGPNGADYPNESRFVELVPGERFVFDHVVPPLFRMRVNFEPVADGTRLEWRMIFEDVDTCARVRAIVVEANEQNLDRLAGELARTS